MMTIELAKRKLEDKILYQNGILGIGVVLSGTDKVIEVAIESREIVSELWKMFPNKKWESFPVNIIIRSKTRAF